MSAALSGVLTGPQIPPHWPFENVSEVKFGHATLLQESPVDYSMIQRLKDRCIRIDAGAFADPALLKTALDPRADDISGKMVLVGDVPLSGDDIFDNPAGPGSLPGIILHASAAYTHTVARPLSVMEECVAPFADLLLAAILLAIVAVVRLTSSPSISEEKLLVSLSWTFGVAVLAFGVFVNLHRYLWDDFVVVALALFSHPSADRWFGKYWHWLHVPSPTAEQESSH